MGKVPLPEHLVDWQTWYLPASAADIAAVRGATAVERAESEWVQRTWSARRRHAVALHDWAAARGLLDEWGRPDQDRIEGRLR